jgi:glycosyltransferase involved in cell wall biosynthesis
MKIAFVYDVIYPYIKGGVEKRVWELAVRLSRRGHEVHIFGMKFWEGEDILMQEGVFLHGVCPAQQLYSGGRRTIWQALSFSIHLFFPLSRGRFDIIDCQQFPYFSCFSAKFISGVKKIPLVITWHEIWSDYWYEYIGWKGFFGVTIERLAARLTSDTIAVSRTTANNLKVLGISAPVKIIPNGVDLTNIKSIRPADQTSDIIFAGRLIREKHVDLLLQAFSILISEHPGYCLTIIGDGPERNTVSTLITRLAIEARVRFLGFQENHDMVLAYMKSSKICVLPSTREGFGITALEGLACGLPVVTIDHPANAIRELINERNGFLCPLTAKDLAETISSGLMHHAEMRNACIETADLYDWDMITRDIETFYRSVIKTGK